MLKSDTTIQDLFNCPVPNVLFLPGDKIEDQLFGIELEIENAGDIGRRGVFYVTEDGSLRNNGYEFISPPMTKRSLVQELDKFFSINKRHIYEDAYSERTSVHIHADARMMTLEQIKSLLLIYQVVENLLFDWIDNDRKNNIFCVPWSQTMLSYNIVNSLENFLMAMNVDMNKYTALNLVPLSTQGTLEFRHMHGNNDVNFIADWLDIIDRLLAIVRESNFQTIKERIINLNTTSHYDQFLHWVFDNKVQLFNPAMSRIMLEEGVLNAKYSLLTDKAVVKKNTEAAPLAPRRAAGRRMRIEPVRMFTHEVDDELARAREEQNQTEGEF